MHVRADLQPHKFIRPIRGNSRLIFAFEKVEDTYGERSKGY